MEKIFIPCRAEAKRKRSPHTGSRHQLAGRRGYDHARAAAAARTISRCAHCPAHAGKTWRFVDKSSGNQRNDFVCPDENVFSVGENCAPGILISRSCCQIRPAPRSKSGWPEFRNASVTRNPGEIGFSTKHARAPGGENAEAFRREIRRLDADRSRNQNSTGIAACYRPIRFTSICIWSPRWAPTRNRCRRNCL